MAIVLTVLFLIGCWTSFYVGIQFQQRRQIPYKKRWQEATALIQSTREEIEAQIRPDIEADVKAQIAKGADVKKLLGITDVSDGAPEVRRLLKMDGWHRTEMEEIRLRKGLPPIDPLSGLSDWDYMCMVEMRLAHGYDEKGQKI